MKIVLLASGIFISILSFAQDVKKKVNEHAKDPKTKEYAAKADVFIQKKQTIADTTAQYKRGQASTKKLSVATKKKKTTKKALRHK